MDWTRRDILKLFSIGAAKLVGLGSGLSLSGCTTTKKPVLADTWRKGVCRFCGTGCGVKIGLRDGEVIEVKGDELAHNRGMVCVKGSMLPEILKLPGRLRHPMIRKNGTLQQATWDQAMSAIAQSFETNLRDHGPESVAFYGSGQLFTEESYTANKLFKGGLRSNNFYSNSAILRLTQR